MSKTTPAMRETVVQVEEIERKSKETVRGRITTLLLAAILCGVIFLVFTATVYVNRMRSRLDDLNTTNRVLSERLERSAALAEQRRVAITIKDTELDTFEQLSPRAARDRAIMRDVLREYLRTYDVTQPKAEDLIKAEACAKFQERGITCRS